MNPHLDLLLSHPALALRVARNPFRYLRKPAHEMPPAFHVEHTRLCLERSAARFAGLNGLAGPERLGPLLERELGRFCGRKSAMYMLCRIFRPQLVVETGVWFGFSSSHILRALADNGGEGRLYSIDQPEHGYDLADGSPFRERLPGQDMTGFVVPAQLRARWELHLGASQQILPGLLERLGTIDMFFHDSEHSYENMAFEFDSAWERLRPGGLLVADDVDWNSALDDFCRARGIRPAAVRAGLAVCVKPGRPAPAALP
ncbi:MAG: class I SAM-dependent methyltransferase [Dehalococcoidia bacterium]